MISGRFAVYTSRPAKLTLLRAIAGAGSTTLITISALPQHPLPERIILLANQGNRATRDPKQQPELLAQQQSQYLRHEECGKLPLGVWRSTVGPSLRNHPAANLQFRVQMKR